MVTNISRNPLKRIIGSVLKSKYFYMYLLWWLPQCLFIATKWSVDSDFYKWIPFEPLWNVMAVLVPLSTYPVIMTPLAVLSKRLMSVVNKVIVGFVGVELFAFFMYILNMDSVFPSVNSDIILMLFVYAVMMVNVFLVGRYYIHVSEARRKAICDRFNLCHLASAFWSLEGIVIGALSVIYMLAFIPAILLVIVSMGILYMGKYVDENYDEHPVRVRVILGIYMLLNLISAPILLLMTERFPLWWNTYMLLSVFHPLFYSKFL